jgi:hypothetical protein
MAAEVSGLSERFDASANFDESCQSYFGRNHRGGCQITGKLQIGVLFDSDFDIVASAIVIFIGFCSAYKNSDRIKTTYAAYYNKDCGSDDGKDFLENPDECAKADKQQTYDKQNLCIALRELIERA